MKPEIELQSTSTVLTIRPVRFQFNPQTAQTNVFQSDVPIGSAEAEQAAGLREFNGLTATLREAGVRVLEFADTPEPHSPDSIFPNNWISTHADGTVVVYPMEAPNRRVERRIDIVERLQSEYGFHVNALVDLSASERREKFLEGTGSLVLDRTNRIAYAALSSRTHQDVLAHFARLLDYEIAHFVATDKTGVAIYHTNVMMCIGTRLAIVCLESVADPGARQRIESRLSATGHEIVDISLDQVAAFAGNMLELATGTAERLLVMSAQARCALSEAQIATIEKDCSILSAPIDSIEKLAGGSVRCMLAEIHLPVT